MTPIHASPFVPGLTTGVVRRHNDSASCIRLLPFDALEQLSRLPAGLIIIGGAPLAHPMIRLYGYGIPTVIVTAEQAMQLHEGVIVTLDGYSGRISDPEDPDMRHYPELPLPRTGQPVQTADGISIELRASVADVHGVANAVAKGATTIGMVRSEFLVPHGGTPPDEAFYYSALKQLCDRAGELPVTVRTLDLAPDKHPAWLGEVHGMTGPLGLRGARLYTHEPIKSVFIAELKALARLLPFHDIRLLLPYMTRPEEYLPLQKALRQVIGQPVSLGVMIETPAAALALPEWLQLVDFVVIGCNDLMQCLFAADRDIPAVAALLDPYSPFLYRFLHHMAGSAGSSLHKIQLGGLLPQVPGVLPLLIGIGYRNFSVEPMLTPCMATIVTNTHTASAVECLEKACSASSTAELRKLLDMPGDLIWGGGKEVH